MARKILLADDSVTAQNMGRRILSDAGYEVITVNNGSAALKKIAELTPDLIVLDVYMPGYGGLEVCQRLKESQATSRIPVLLTVGKLEPFKAEEARRVRAEGHIVKPFDATELLAAIMRLEDRIVPQAAPNKPGRSAKAAAAVEEAPSRRVREKSADPTTETSSGWKKRLSIPRKPAVQDERESEPEIAGTAFHDLARKADLKPSEAKSEELEVSSAVPPSNVAPEENAASATSFPKFTDLVSSKETASLPPEESNKELEVKAEAVVPETPVTESLPSVVVSEAPIHPGETPVASEQSPTGEEVTAALASLSPVSDTTPNDTDQLARVQASAGATDNIDTARRDDSRDQAFSALGAALAAVSTALARPRWTAERVPLSDGDSHLLLEAEMEKAYAAFAAADNAGIPPSMEEARTATHETSIPVTPAPSLSGPELPSITASETLPPSPVVRAEGSLTAPDTNTADETSVMKYASYEPGLSEPALPEPALSAPTLSEPALPESAAQIVEQSVSVQPIDVVANASVEAQVPQAENTDAVASEPVASTAYRDIAYAAAASASSTGREPIRSGFISSDEVSPSSQEMDVAPVAAESPTVNEEAVAEVPHSVAEVASSNAEVSDSPQTEASDSSDPERESQLVAAWQNWRQIRESIIGEQLPSQTTEATDGSFKEIRPEQKAEPKADVPEIDAESLVADRAVAEASAIAGIVDSVLSELRPKLMEEISRKLAKDRK